MFRAGVLTVSDKGSLGQRVDESGKVIMETLKAKGFDVGGYLIVPDERDIISAKLIEMSDVLELDLILTTGGTGFSQRDVTPEATLDVIDKHAPGIPEAIRARSLSITPRAMLSRATAGIRGKTLIVNLPGSPKSVRECLEVFIDQLPHALGILKGTENECGRGK